MAGKIKFIHDTVNDIVIAEPIWKVSTIEDCEIWFSQWADYLNTFNRKMDCIMVLDDFIVDSAISSKWGEYRARVVNNFTRFSYRVDSNLATGIYIKTSGITYNACSKEAISVESAIEAIKEERKNAGVD
jgi:hypothetical protein